MADVIDFTKYKNKISEIEKELGCDISAEIDQLLIPIIEKYSSKLKNMDHSFTIEISPEAGKKLKKVIETIRTEYQELVIEVVAELMQTKTDLFLKEKGYR